MKNKENKLLQFYFFDTNNYDYSYIKKNSLFFNTKQSYKKNFFYSWILLNKYKNKNIFSNFSIFFDVLEQNNKNFYLLSKNNLIPSSFFTFTPNNYIFNKFLCLNFFKLFFRLLNFLYKILYYIRKTIFLTYTFFVKKKITICYDGNN